MQDLYHQRYFLNVRLLLGAVAGFQSVHESGRDACLFEEWRALEACDPRESQ